MVPPCHEFRSGCFSILLRFLRAVNLDALYSLLFGFFDVVKRPCSCLLSMMGFFPHNNQFQAAQSIKVIWEAQVWGRAYLEDSS